MLRYRGWPRAILEYQAIYLFGLRHQGSGTEADDVEQSWNTRQSKYLGLVTEAELFTDIGILFIPV